MEPTPIRLTQYTRRHFCGLICGASSAYALMLGVLAFAAPPAFDVHEISSRECPPDYDGEWTDACKGVRLGNGHSNTTEAPIWWRHSLRLSGVYSLSVSVVCEVVPERREATEPRDALFFAELGNMSTRAVQDIHCSAGQRFCGPVTLLRGIPAADDATLGLRVESPWDESGALAWLGDVRVVVRAGRVAFKRFEAAFKICFAVLALGVLSAYLLQVCNVPAWSVEQRCVVVLLLLLPSFNDPAGGLGSQRVFAILGAVCLVGRCAFLCVLLVLWCSLLETLARPGRTPWCGERVLKAAGLAALFLSSAIYVTWVKTMRRTDPLFAMRPRVPTGVLSVGIVSVILLVVYAAYMCSIAVRGREDLAWVPAAPRGMLMLSFVMLAASLVNSGIIVANPSSTSAAVALWFDVLVNVYTLTLAFLYTPTGVPRSIEEVRQIEDQKILAELYGNEDFDLDEDEETKAAWEKIRNHCDSDSGEENGSPLDEENVQFISHRDDC